MAGWVPLENCLPKDEQVEIEVIEETEMFADEEPKANENQEDGMVELGSNQTNAFTFKILRHSVKCRGK